MEELKKLYEKAKMYGISRADIGAFIWGKKQYSRIYLVKNPTLGTYKKVENAINNMIEMRKNGKNFL